MLWSYLHFIECTLIHFLMFVWLLNFSSSNNVGCCIFRLLERSNLLNKTCLLTLFRTFFKKKKRFWIQNFFCCCCCSFESRLYSESKVCAAHFQKPFPVKQIKENIVAKSRSSGRRSVVWVRRKWFLFEYNCYSRSIWFETMCRF